MRHIYSNRYHAKCLEGKPWFWVRLCLLFFTASAHLHPQKSVAPPGSLGTHCTSHGLVVFNWPLPFHKTFEASLNRRKTNSKQFGASGRLRLKTRWFRWPCPSPSCKCFLQVAAQIGWGVAEDPNPGTIIFIMLYVDFGMVHSWTSPGCILFLYSADLSSKNQKSYLLRKNRTCMQKMYLLGSLGGPFDC